MPLSEARREAVKRAAGYRCEYCHIAGWPLTIDHVTPLSAWTAAGREGRVPPPFPPDDPGNTAAACWECNVIGKDEQTSGEDPETGEKARLFHPRLDSWDDCFEWVEDYTIIRGRNAVGRATIAALGLNLPHYVAQRRRLRAATLAALEQWP